jgi:hypothetical protein
MVTRPPLSGRSFLSSKALSGIFSSPSTTKTWEGSCLGQVLGFLILEDLPHPPTPNAPLSFSTGQAPSFPALLDPLPSQQLEMDSPETSFVSLPILNLLLLRTAICLGNKLRVGSKEDSEFY